MAKPKKPKGGRKPDGEYAKTPIDLEQVEAAGQLHCTTEELAMICKMSHRALQRRLEKDEALREAFERGKATGKLRLRRRIVQQANSPGPSGVTASLHLAKHVLGQTDKSAVELTGPGGAPLQPMIILTGAPPKALAGAAKSNEDKD